MNNEDRYLGLVRSLGLAESHSVNLGLGCRFHLKAHARDICSQVVEWGKKQKGSTAGIGEYVLR